MNDQITLVKQPLPENRKAGMTLGEVRAFVAEADRAGITDTTIVWAGVGWRGQLQQVQVDSGKVRA